jgi:hypothetical protein
LASQLESTDRNGSGARDPFHGASVMAGLMRQMDWAATPLGHPDT